MNYRQDDWEEWLEIAKFSHNNHTNASTRQTPFFINYGQHPWTGDPTWKETRLEAVEQFTSKMKETHNQATQAIKEVAQNMKNTHDNHARSAANYKEGDQVYLEVTNIQTDRPSQKLDDWHYGPFKVKHKVGQAAYELDLPEKWKGIYLVFNKTYLSSYHTPLFLTQQPPPLPPAIEVEGEPEYKVEEVLSSRKWWGQIQYLVQWKGYRREHNSWQSISDMEHSQDLICDFHARFPDLPAPTTIHHLSLGETQLYDPDANRYGCDFIPPKPDNKGEDWILPLPREEVDTLIETRNSLEATLFPTTAKRVWIVEK